MTRPATTLTRDESSPQELLEEAFAAARAEQEIPQDFPPEVAEEVATALAAAELPDRDETAVEFVTIDPVEAMDLDQAMNIERDGDGYRVRYAIADVPLYVRAGGAIDAETRKRGVTVYCPDRRVPLHPTELSEDAASLLPDAERSAYIWDIRLDGQGHRTSTELYRARVRSRRRYHYHEAQRQIDAGEAEDTLMLLKQVGELRIQRELERGGASLPMPEQEVEKDSQADGTEAYVIRLRPLLPAEDWNAQISLLTGMAAADLMLEGGVGILRTMPVPNEHAVQRFRREAKALGRTWPKDQTYGEFLRSLDREDPAQLAIIHAATMLFRGAGYTSFAGELPPEKDRVQAALAAPYAHVTAPLRRLVDRFGLAICAALSAGEEAPGWARDALPSLPEVMEATDQRARAVDRACVAAVEAAVLSGRVGEEVVAAVTDEAGDGRVAVLLLDPPVSDVAQGRAEVGSKVLVRVEAADVRAGEVKLSVVGAVRES